jgi:hypothetical protein
MGDNQIPRRDPEGLISSINTGTTEIHEGLGQQDSGFNASYAPNAIETLIALFLQADAKPTGNLICQHKTDIVTGLLVFFTRIAEPNQ